MIKAADVLIYRGRAYVPTDAQTEDGLFVQVEPVFSAEPTTDAIATAITRALNQELRRVPSLTPDEWRRRKDPMLAVTGAKSWRALAKRGASYGIVWELDHVTLYPSALDKQGRFVEDPNKTRIFPKDASLEAIVEAILVDARARPEVWT